VPDKKSFDPKLWKTYGWVDYPGGQQVVALPQSVIRSQPMKYNQTTLGRIEKILDEASYIVRYERGTFQSGYCILEDKRVVVLNKFLDTEGRINILIELVPQLSIIYEMLTTDAQKMYDEILLKSGNLAAGDKKSAQ
jgi:hypothetical protein